MKTLDDAREAVTLDKFSLDDENIRQPQLMFDISQKHAAAQNKKREAKQLVDEMYAELDTELRKNLAQAQEKLSEPQIKQRIILMPKMKEIERYLLLHERIAEQWFGAYEAIKAKGYALNNLGALYAANYFSTESGGRARADAKEVAAQKAREFDSTRRRSRKEA